MPGSLSEIGVLVVDDNTHAQTIWHAILAAAGAWHVGAGDVGSAQQMLMMHPIGLAVVDEHLERESEPGSNLIAWMRASGDPRIAAMPVLACTSDEAATTTRRLLDAGADLIVNKPIVVSHALAALGGLARVHREARQTVQKFQHHNATNVLTYRPTHDQFQRRPFAAKGMQ